MANDTYYKVTKMFKELELNKDDDIKNLDRIRTHPAEELNHFLYKCISSRVAAHKKLHFMTEVKVNQKRLDLLILNPDNDMQLAHEFETVKKKDYIENSLKKLNHNLIDIKVHYLKDLPTDPVEIEKYLKLHIF